MESSLFHLGAEWYPSCCGHSIQQQPGFCWINGWVTDQTDFFLGGDFATFLSLSSSPHQEASKELREAIKHQHLGQLHCSAALSLVQQLAATHARCSSVQNLPPLHEQTGTQPHSNFPTCTCPPPFPSISSFSLFASQHSALPRASLRLILFSVCSFFVLYSLALGVREASLAAISRRFDLLRFVIPAWTSLQCFAFSVYSSLFHFRSPPLGHFRCGARWLAPPHGRARPTVLLLRCNSR